MADMEQARIGVQLAASEPAGGHAAVFAVSSELSSPRRHSECAVEAKCPPVRLRVCGSSDHQKDNCGDDDHEQQNQAADDQQNYHHGGPDSRSPGAGLARSGEIEAAIDELHTATWAMTGAANR